MDIVFVNTNSAKQIYQPLAQRWSAIEPPTWSLLLAQSCRSKGYDVAILDAIAENLSHEETALRVLEMKPRFCCFVTYGQQPNSGTVSMVGVYEVAKLVKENSDIKTISIGSHTQALPREVLSNPNIDYVALNDGTSVLHDLLNGLQELKIVAISGLGWKLYGKEPCFNSVSPAQVNMEQDLDRLLPGYAWDLLPYKNKPFDLYRAHLWHAEYQDEYRNPFAAMYTSLGCKFKCNFCLLGGTVITTSKGKNKTIEELQIGDKLLSWNEDKLCIEETDVLKTISRKTNKIYKIKLSDGKMVSATAEHPFYVEGKWVEVKNLHVGDKLLVIEGKDKVSFMMKNNNPMFSKNTRDKVSKTSKENFKNGITVPYLCTDSGKKQISEIAKKKMLSEENPSYKDKNRKAASERLQGENNPKWNNGSCVKFKPYYLAKPKKARKECRERDNNICQECGKDHGKMDCHHIDYNKFNNQQSNLITLCASCHTKTNFDKDFWQKRYTQIMLDRSIDCPHYVRIESIEESNGEYVVYNIECSPYNNYFAENILNHNCMINIVNRTSTNEKAVSSDFNNMRFWSPELMLKEFDKLIEYGVTTIRLSDEMFFLNKKYYEQLLLGLKERGYGDILRMWSYSRVDTVNERFLDTFREGGIKWLALGIETANQEVRREITKGKFENVNVRDVVKQISDHGLYTIANYIFGHPTDTLETMQQTLDLALELNTESANMWTAMALPGSPLYYEAKENGWKLPEKFEEWSFYSYECQPLPTKYLQPEEVLRFRDEAWHKYFENPKFLNLVKGTFGQSAHDNIVEQSKIKLKRRILGD